MRQKLHKEVLSLVPLISVILRKLNKIILPYFPLKCAKNSATFAVSTLTSIFSCALDVKGKFGKRNARLFSEYNINALRFRLKGGELFCEWK
jgi:hypothetical protein